MSKALAKVLAPTKNGKSARLPTPAERPLETASGLEGIPYLGESRRAALALAGLRTRDDLNRVTVEQIGGVKGVGMVNAAHVKDYLKSQASVPGVPSESIDPGLANANQQVQDIFHKLEAATSRLKQNYPTKNRDKALDRQLAKLDTVASELAEGPDTLTAAQVEKAVKTLDKIAELLTGAAGAEKPSQRKQAVLIEELRDRRKRLQKTLGD